METKISTRPEPAKNEKEKKGGFLSMLLLKLGLGGAATGGAGLGAIGAGSAASGMGLLASKTGVVALILAGSAVAAGVSMFRTPGASRPSSGAGIFGQPPSGEGSQTMAGANSAGEGAQGASASGVSDSLDYFNKANQGAVGDPAKTAESEAAGEGDDVASADAAADGEEVSSGVEAPDNSNGGGASGGFNRPTMAKAKKSFRGKSSKTTGMQLAANPAGASGQLKKSRTASLSTSGADRSKSGTRRSSAVHRGKSALSQAKTVQRSHRNAMASRNLTSASAGRAYDGGRGSGGAIGAPAGSIGGAGSGVGGRGVGTSNFTPNRTLNTRELPEPKEVGAAKNKTPYQESLDMAMYAIMAAGALLMAAGLMKKAAKTNPAWSTGVKIAAGLAAAAAGIALMKGMELMNTHGQGMQGMMFMAMGGIIMFQAGRILWDEFAGDKAEEGVKDVSKMTGDEIRAEKLRMEKIPEAKWTPDQVKRYGNLDKGLETLKKIPESK